MFLPAHSLHIYDKHMQPVFIPLEEVCASPFYIRRRVFRQSSTIGAPIRPGIGGMSAPPIPVDIMTGMKQSGIWL